MGLFTCSVTYLSPVKGDGTFECIDGQNTILAAAIRGHETIPAFVAASAIAHPGRSRVQRCQYPTSPVAAVHVWHSTGSLVVNGRWHSMRLHLVTASQWPVVRQHNLATVYCRTTEKDCEVLDAALGVLKHWDGTQPEHAQAPNRLVLGMTDLINGLSRPGSPLSGSSES